MNIEIKVSVSMDDMSPIQSQKIRRMAYIMREAGFEVDVLWGCDNTAKNKDMHLAVRRTA
jgi:hypothetical protein